MVDQNGGYAFIEDEFDEITRVLELIKGDTISVVTEAARLILKTLKKSGTIYLCGNGGSAGQCQHFAAELTGRFQAARPGKPAVSLTTDTSALTSIANDFGFSEVFSRQIEALCSPKDLLIAISTSSTSENVIKAMHKASEDVKMKVIGLCGYRPDKEFCELSDVLITIPKNVRTCRIQEIHLVILHAIAGWVDMHLGMDSMGFKTCDDV